MTNFITLNANDKVNLTLAYVLTYFVQHKTYNEAVIKKHTLFTESSFSAGLKSVRFIQILSVIRRFNT